MILAQGTENGLSWSLDAKGMNIYIRVIQDNTNKEFVKKYECQFEPFRSELHFREYLLLRLRYAI